MFSHATISSFIDEMHKIAEDIEKKDLDIQAIKRKIELWSKLHDSSEVPVNVDHEDVGDYGGGFYDRKDKLIAVTNHDYESLAHELGHAGMDESLLGKLIQHPVNRTMFPWTPVAGAIGGALAARGKKMGLLLPALTGLPTLLSEWLATRRGAERLEDIGATPEEIDTYRKNLGDSFATYHGVIPQSLLAGVAGYAAGSQ
jgi:hypothetical protein